MNYSLELIRLIAVIIITFTHTRNDFTQGLQFSIFEQLPQVGTVMLSIISGYLYINITSQKKGSLLVNKLKTLFIPFLIANLVVLSLVLVAQFGFGKNFLNRLSYDYTLITDGIFALNAVPINPPTYFVRDIFVVFLLVDVLRNKNFYSLLILIPLLMFGKIFLNISIPIMFGIGACIALYSSYIHLHLWKVIGVFLVGIFTCYQWYSQDISVLKYPLAMLLFLILFPMKIKFFNVGGYTYLLHLYHSPIIVSSYPILKKYIEHPTLNVLAQISVALISIGLLYLLTRKFKSLRGLCGGK